ncbi:pectinesterase-like [Magnolia sinica]|uniref:pectinesterase-like n=1 Tax=Magnolia sinica TaxID=86752 RepID=UPI00265917AA|nr:pectinesterase-like [Magnolia sinica]
MASKGYGQVSGADQGGKSKKMAIMGLSSLILVAMVVAVAVGVSKNKGTSGPSTDAGDTTEIKTSSKAITAICQPTDYKESCVKSLSSVAGDNTTDPKELIKLSFQVAIENVKKAFNESATLQEAEKDPIASKALENCKELMDYSLDDLNSSLDKLGEFDLSKLDDLLDDIKIWLSGSLTYQETCVDGFDGSKSDAGSKMKEAIRGGSELTSNVIAIVDELSSILTSLDLPFLNRRLLSTDGDAAEDEIPSWVSSGRRGLLSSPLDSLTPDVVVAKDGSGKFKTINEAVATIPKKSPNPFIIHIKEGVYAEQVTIDKSLMNVVMIGDGPTKTKITGKANFIDGTPTFKTSTVAVIGEGFMAKGIGFENSAGAAKHQAVALRVQSDRAVFFNCQMDGYQDTLYVHTHRQFYRECTISGTIDFIFGNAAVVFQNCKIIVRKPMDNQQNIITAQGRKDRREPTGIIIHNCNIVADPELFPVRNKLKTYLGRPWKLYSRTFFIQSDIGDLVQPVGWLPWEGDFALNSCFYAEYGNRGAGSDTSQRAKWKGIKGLTPERAEKFTVARFIQGNLWLKKSGVPYTPGLMPA